MPKVRALTSWAGRKAGDEWDASDEDARILCAPDLPGGQRAEYLDRAMRAANPPPTSAPTASAPQEKRRYLRRDLRAEP
jgi:hypothetical protein